MRKDVKLGLAVGGVLLAVLVVYVLVVPGNNTNQVGATLENLDGSAVQSTEETAGGTDGTARAEGTAAGGKAGGAAGGATAEPGSSGTSDGATADAGANEGDAATSSGEKPSGESAGGGWNWDALVNGTEKVPSLAAGINVPSNATLAGGGRPVNQSSAGNDTSDAGGSSITDPAAQQGGAGAAGAGAANDNTTLSDSPQAPVRENPLAGQTERVNADPAPTTPASGGARTHVVKAGDTYSKISLAAYGTSKHYARIEQANPGVDPTRLKPGQTITLPVIETTSTAAPAAAGAQATLDPQKEYKVQPNDSLYTISLRLYGKSDRMEKIYELNKAVIGDDMSRVKVGTVLKLPEPPTQTTAAASR